MDPDFVGWCPLAVAEPQFTSGGQVFLDDNGGWTVTPPGWEAYLHVRAGSEEWLKGDFLARY